MVPEITVEELKKRLDSDPETFLVDVREPDEYEICKIPGAKLIPLGQVQDRLAEFETDKEIVVHCRSGARSAQATEFLISKGKKAVNVAGGILAWADRIDPSVQKY